MLLVANAAFVAIEIEAVETAILAERLLRGHAAGRRRVERAHGQILGRGRIPFGDRITQRLGVHGGHVAVDQAGTMELGQNAEDAACAVHVLDVVLLRGGRDLAQAGNLARDLIDVRHGELHLGLLRARQEVQDRIGRAAHGHVQRYGVLERLEGRDGSR